MLRQHFIYRLFHMAVCPRSALNNVFALGLVRLEQKNVTFLDLFIFDDGPFEVGDENLKNPDLVPTPSNSYLGKSKIRFPLPLDPTRG